MTKYAYKPSRIIEQIRREETLTVDGLLNIKQRIFSVDIRKVPLRDEQTIATVRGRPLGTTRPASAHYESMLVMRQLIRLRGTQQCDGVPQRHDRLGTNRPRDPCRYPRKWAYRGTAVEPPDHAVTDHVPVSSTERDGERIRWKVDVFVEPRAGRSPGRRADRLGGVSYVDFYRPQPYRESTMNLRRTLLITPASDGELVRKGRATDADVLFLDLEDAIPSEEKESARAAVVDHLTSELDADDDVAVRINGVETPWWYEDVIETVSAAGATIDSLILPKVTGERHLHAVDLLLKQVETNAGLDGEGVGLIPQLESTAGINNAISIARSVDRLTALMFGPGDYAASVGVRGASGEPESGRRWEYARSRIVNAAREVGIQAIDGMYPETGDVEAARQALSDAGWGWDDQGNLHYPEGAELEAWPEGETPNPDNF